MKCTWIKCRNNKAHDHIATDGKVWARLCNKHHGMVESALDDFFSGKTDPSKTLSYWIKAQGGSGKMTEAMGKSLSIKNITK